jgi:protein-S-isoprenylcysteine O-methyltransferase Ste14
MNISIFSIALMVLYVACFGSFAWGMQKMFNIPKPAPLLVNLTKVIGTVFAFACAFQIFRTPLSPSAALVAGIFYIFGGVLFWSAVFATRHQKFDFAFVETKEFKLLTVGPYKRIRHPYYTAYALGWLGNNIASDHWVVRLAFVCMCGLYFIAAKREESGFLNSESSNAYAIYKRQAGMFFPRIL